MEERNKSSAGFTTSHKGLSIKKLTFEEVEIGNVLPPFTKWITIKTCLLSMGIQLGGEDTISGHTDPERSEKQFGVKTMPVQGEAIAAGVTPLMLGWLRDTKPWIIGGKHDLKFIRLVSPGDTLTYYGKVTDKKIEGNIKYIFCDIWAENQSGEKVMVGQTRACFSG